MERLVDLHTHSSASDGRLSPEELVSYAKKKGAAAISLTDHDTVEGVGRALAAGRTMELEVVPGLEISAEHPGGSMHILGYFIDHNHPYLNQELLRLQEARRERNPKIIDRLRALGHAISFQQVQALAKGQIGRPHIAQVLLQNGVVQSMEEAFQKYLTKGAPAYVEKFRFSPRQAINMIRQGGGLAVLAHPFTLNCRSKGELKNLVEQLKGNGLKGLEVFYSEHSPEQTTDYLNLAGELDLCPTGGSDFHGDNNPEIDLLSGIGNLRVPYEILEKLKATKRTG